jgi:dTDP-4-dehydrorhamnose 3,5-epimerase
MQIIETKIKNAYVIVPEKKSDNRGFFVRIWDKNFFQKFQLKTEIIQCSISSNKKKGTLRGMHFQKKPYEEAKWVTCIKGKIYDVILDLRPNSPSYKKWVKIELSSKNYKVLYVPEGVAHGFQTLENETLVFYQICQEYNLQSSSGILYNDPEFKIRWPLKISNISDKDLSYNSFHKADTKISNI